VCRYIYYVHLSDQNWGKNTFFYLYIYIYYLYIIYIYIYIPRDVLRPRLKIDHCVYVCVCVCMCVRVCVRVCVGGREREEMSEREYVCVHV